MDVRLVTGSVISGVVDTTKLNTSHLTQIMIRGVELEYSTISVKFTFQNNTTTTIQSLSSHFHQDFGNVYRFDEITDTIISIEIYPTNLISSMDGNFSSMSIENLGRTTYERPIDLGNEILITTYNLPVGSKLYFHEDANSNVEYFGIKPSWVYVNDKQIGAMIKNIQSDSTLYYEENGNLYKAIYGNGGDCEGGLTKTYFTLV